MQIEPLRNKQANKCDGKNGCTPQPDILIFNRYRIEQQENGIPTIEHSVVEKVEGKLVGGTKAVSYTHLTLPTTPYV